MSGTWIGVEESGEVTVVVIRSAPDESRLAFSHHGRTIRRSIQKLSFKKYALTLKLSEPIYDHGKATISGTVGYGRMRLEFGRGEFVVLHRKEQLLSDVAAAEAELDLSIQD
jgi:hypothetical protein